MAQARLGPDPGAWLPVGQRAAARLGLGVSGQLPGAQLPLAVPVRLIVLGAGQVTASEDPAPEGPPASLIRVLVTAWVRVARAQPGTASLARVWPEASLSSALTRTG